MRLVETIKGLSQPVHTISMFSASMSFMLSQYSATRYALSSSTIMSHRASLGGVEGQIPGSFFSRSNNLMASVTEIEQHVADRAGYSLETYRDMIADELWMTGTGAMEAKFIDSVVAVRCDESLSDYGPIKEVAIFIFKFKARFHKCLSFQPLSL